MGKGTTSTRPSEGGQTADERKAARLARIEAHLVDIEGALAECRTIMDQLLAEAGLAA